MRLFALSLFGVRGFAPKATIFSVLASVCVLSVDVSALAGPDRPGTAPPPLHGRATTPPSTSPIADEAPPQLPTDRGPITTPTFTLSADRPVAPGRAWLRFYAFRTWAKAGSLYQVVSNGGGGNGASVLVMLEPALRGRAFVSCHVTNEDTTRDAAIVTDTGVEKIAPRSARWLKGSSVIWHPSGTTSTNVAVDRCQVTGYAAAPPAQAPVPAEVARARLRGARIGNLLAGSKTPAAPPPLANGPITSSVVLSAQQPIDRGASLSFGVVSSGGPVGTGAELTAFTNDNAYTANFIVPDGLDGSNVSIVVEIRVKVAKVPMQTASVTCSIANLGDKPATFSGNALPAHVTRWIDMTPNGANGQDDEFLLQDAAFGGAIAVHECRVRMQSSAVVSPGPIGPAAAGPGLGAAPPPLGR